MSFVFAFFLKVVVVLSSLSTIKDLLEKRGEILLREASLPIAEMYILYFSFSSAATLTILDP
jgi:hypothetical protein